MNHDDEILDLNSLHGQDRPGLTKNTGILSGTAEEVQYRINARIRRLEQVAGQVSEARALPAWIVVVEFSAPIARMENYEPNP